MRKSFTSEQEDNFIEGIFNYCDRWCERCPFTARCRVFAIEQEDPDDLHDITQEAFWGKISDIFAQTKQMLQEIAEERGIDLDAVSDEEFAEIRQRQDEQIRQSDLTKSAERYYKEAKTLLDNKDEWLIFSALDEETQDDMLSILYWYQYFIAAKIHRGLHSILDVDGYFDEEELNDSQSDTNGSIKIALIAVERSIMAWTNLLTRENSSLIKPLLILLEQIRRKCEEKFPLARDFIRPGFDELETIM